MEQISAIELKHWLTDAERSKPVMIDVREFWEIERCKFDGAQVIPLATVPANVSELDRDANTVMICHHGVRSAQVGMFLEQQGFSRIVNLTGGVAAWAGQVDPAMPTY